MKLTDRIQASGASLTDLIHIVITSDTTQNSAGSSFKIPMSEYAALFGGGTDSYWTSGSTGTNSIKAINSSSIDATGNYAVAEGRNTIASGSTSHAEGNGSIAGGDASHAEGQGSRAFGGVSHAEGFESTAFSDYSHAEGQLTTALGVTSHAEGNSTIASGNTSHAEGSGSTAGGNNSHAEGWSTTATGDGSHAEGYLTKALTAYTHSEGVGNISSGIASHSEGGYWEKNGGILPNTASGESSHAEGADTTASGGWSHAEGATTKALGSYTHAEGNDTIASGDTSHAEGASTIAIGGAAHSEGGNTIAFGDNSHAEGISTTAIGNQSHTEGRFTTASSDNSHAGGEYTIASGNTSFVHGSNSIAGGTNTIVLGANITGNTNETLYTNKVKSIYGISAGTLDAPSVNTANYTELATSVNNNGYTNIGNINIVRPYGLTADTQSGFIGSYNAAYWDRDTPFELTHPTYNLVGSDAAVYVVTSATTTVNRIIGFRSSLISPLSGVTITDNFYFKCNAPNETAMYGMQNVYGFHMEPHAGIPGFTAGTTNLWGVYIDDTDAKNYFGNTVGIGTNIPYSGSILELESTTKALVITRMTDTQATAITPINGMMLYVTTIGGVFISKGFWGYEEGVWVKL